MAERQGLEETSSREARKIAQKCQLLVKAETRARVKKISEILKKPEDTRTKEEVQILQQSPDVVADMQKRARRRDKLKEQLKEVEDPPEVLCRKASELATAVQQARHLVVYTGAGISTAASIPDYRGPNGVWTLLQQGRPVETRSLTDAQPTVTHMALARLHQEGYVKHVVSQNCDGLHLRSGLPRQALSEVHGNMYIEVCTECDPELEYIRLFDVTERTSLHRHMTDRSCHACGEPLRDSIVHFGERSCLEQPHNWEDAMDNAKKADTILCLGSSLKVLKRYSCLWGKTRVLHKRPKLFIVNLQWTPKDDNATLKIHGKCDELMVLLMKKLRLDIPLYRRENDPIFKLVTPLLSDEHDSFSTRQLTLPTDTTSLRTQQESLSPTCNGNEKDTDQKDHSSYKPGWFGKGCAKRRSSTAKRRKSNTTTSTSVKLSE
ncbi:PREDICTED: NAD-dependent protein deacetylase sirtuin-7-like [Branchiostoma belcheri]|uniref:NAD-dependent protein deacetylase sirtuin-7 n=1 Tax=Branchiostoma belcheri TaxID=7741 RepID=A0A6P4Y9X4_BRABE|nr:PREDICTED: NAD-dependent protein deacetylase sirtuin-7-like [Branchiostoma belcheri]